MRNQACEILGPGDGLFDLFDLKGDGFRAIDRLREFELAEPELRWWLLPHASRVSRAVRGDNVRQMSSAPLADPLELFRLIGSHAMAARSLLYPMRAPAYWVRRQVDGAERAFRPALPESQLSDLLQVPTRQVGPALRPLLLDGCVELVRSPAGVRAVLLVDGFVEEGRLRTRLRA